MYGLSQSVDASDLTGKKCHGTCGAVNAIAMKNQQVDKNQLLSELPRLTSRLAVR